MNLNYLEWSQEDKDRYAAEKVEDARKRNIELRRNHIKAEKDRLAAEKNNSGFTNYAKIQDVSPEKDRQFNPGNSNRFSSMQRACPSSTYTREWDKGKGSGEWELEKPKGFKDYKLDDHENMYFKSERRTSARNERYYRKYNYRSHASSKSESTATWNTDRSDEDKNKYERTSKWIKSVQKCNLGQGKSSAGKEESNTNPKRKYDQKAMIPRKSCTKFDRINRSDHSSNDSDSDCLESKKQDCIEKDNKSFEQKETITNPKRKTEQKAITSRKSYTKLNRINRSDNSFDSYSNSDMGPNHEYIKKDNFEKNHSEGKKEQYNSDKEKLNIETKSAIKSVCQLNASEFQQYGTHRKVYYHNEGFIISREFTCRNKAYNEQDLKQGSKTKRNPNTNPQYSTPSNCKNELFTKQRKFDKGQSNELSNTSSNVNRVMQTKKYTSHIKASGFDVVPSSNQDQKDGWDNIEHSQDGNDGWGKIEHSQGGDDGWGNIEHSQGGDDGWGSIEHSQDENDDGWKNIKESQDKVGAWAAAVQYGMKKVQSEKDSDLEKKSDYNRKEAKAFKVKSPTGSDDGGWSTVEEGEIPSEDDLEENREHVK